MEPIQLYDTTLRDGTQGENISFSAQEKLEIARRLDDLGIHYIEGGWPGSNPRDIQFFELARRHAFRHSRMTAFASTRKPDCAAAADPNLAALLESDTPAVAIFGKSWDLHAEQILGTSLDENLRMIEESVAYMKARDREVIYDAEHFFDGLRENRDYALRTLRAAVAGGAEAVVLCDTNGGSLPGEITAVVESIRRELPDGVRIGIHTHNDCGLAVANSLAAVESGATMVQGTINGYGERCGNADLTTLIPLLALKLNRPSVRPDQLAQIKKVSRFVSETANMIPDNGRPFVGSSAFAHKGGIHVNAVMKNARAYEHMTPDLVGNQRRVLVSDLAGRSNVEYKARELGVDLTCNGADCREIAAQVKQLEQDGYQFDVADGSFKILLEKFTSQYQPFFELHSFRISVEKDQEDRCRAHATIKIEVGGREEITAAEGDGPVSALDNALRKALYRFYPQLAQMRLVDFKVRVIDGRAGTAARVRVFIESRDTDEVWRTIGVSEDIIEASWQALLDSMHYKLSKDGLQAASPEVSRAAGAGT